MNKPDGIDEALGLDEPALPTTVVLEPMGNDLAVTNAEDDLEYARRNIRDAIEDAKEAVTVMADTVKTSGAAKEAEALSNLLDKFVQANERLVNLVKKPVNPNGVEGGATKVVNNTNNVVMVGSTDDLLKTVRKARGERDEEDFLER